MSRRSRVIGFGSALVLVLVGVVGGVGFGGTFGQVLALILISLGGVLATALVFYEVGLSEDRERAREARLRVPEEGEARPAEKGEGRPAEKGEGRRVSRGRGHLDRRRGQRRRLDR
ncbi:MAG TPA: hypothetical protein VKR21_09115 [Solirubrobacteraceae bacterium]|nr:hypothetical protein [Solirubrobacteraceae bacterium]